MFSLFSSAISVASEVIAPSLPLVEELSWRWNEITSFYVDKKSEHLKEGVALSKIPQHLMEINRILQEEEANMIGEVSQSGIEEGDIHGHERRIGGEADSIGPCMEYILQYRILDTMSVLAQTDTPPGMCEQVLNFLTNLITNSSMQLLPHASAFNATQKLIMICGRLMAGPYERSEVQFLACICHKINSNPHLINCFLRDSFPLVSALLSLLQSPDTEISTIAGDALIKLVSVLNDVASIIITQNTPFSSKIISQLVSLYQSIPCSLKPDEIQSAINCCFKNQQIQDINSFTSSVRKFLCFLRWYILFDMIVHHTPKSSPLITSLLTQFKDEFLDSCILPDLVGSGYREQVDADEHILLTTAILAEVLRNTTCHHLGGAIGDFLLVQNDVNSMHSNGDVIIEMSERNNVRDLLIRRCLLMRNECNITQNEQTRIDLCMTTMQLFEEILNKPSKAVIESLILSYLMNRSYFDASITDGDAHFDFNDLDEPRMQLSLVMKDDESGDASISGSGSLPSRSSSTFHIHRVLHYFTSLVPDELKSESLGYEAYVREEQKHYQDCASICDEWSWPNEPVNKDASDDGNLSCDSTPEAEAQMFHEGPFISMVFDNLENMVNLPYHVNLQVTSLISKLAVFPHPNLSEYLLDPILPISRGTRTLFGILHRLVDELQISVQGLANLKSKLYLTRKTLLGEADNDVTQLGMEAINGDKVCIMEALIVIEEFCKELAAIAFVKYHNTN